MRPSKKKARPALRVRHDPPTLLEAAVAAQGFTDDIEHQAEIAAQLMGASLEEARAAVAEATKIAAAEAREAARRTTIVTPASRFSGPNAPPARAVVVERRPSRSFSGPRPTTIRLPPR